MSIIKVTCPNCHKIFEVVSKERIPRTNQQNKWYWACIVGIPAKHYGYTADEMHEAYKLLFLRRNEEGKPETIRSTTKLDTKQFSEYVEKCRRWAAEQGFYIPDPEEVYVSSSQKVSILSIWDGKNNQTLPAFPKCVKGAAHPGPGRA